VDVQNVQKTTIYLLKRKGRDINKNVYKRGIKKLICRRVLCLTWLSPRKHNIKSLQSALIRSVYLLNVKYSLKM